MILTMFLNDNFQKTGNPKLNTYLDRWLYVAIPNSMTLCRNSKFHDFMSQFKIPWLYVAIQNSLTLFRNSKFPDFMSQFQIPWLYVEIQNSLNKFKIHWLFLDLEKLCFSLTIPWPVRTLWHTLSAYSHPTQTTVHASQSPNPNRVPRQPHRQAKDEPITTHTTETHRPSTKCEKSHCTSGQHKPNKKQTRRAQTTYSQHACRYHHNSGNQAHP